MCTGSAPNAFAMVGKAVAITVESRFCMNIAQATIIAVSRVWPLMRRLTVRTGLEAGSGGSFIGQGSVALPLRPDH